MRSGIRPEFRKMKQKIRLKNEHYVDVDQVGVFKIENVRNSVSPSRLIECENQTGKFPILTPEKFKKTLNENVGLVTKDTGDETPFKLLMDICHFLRRCTKLESDL